MRVGRRPAEIAIGFLQAGIFCTPIAGDWRGMATRSSETLGFVVVRPLEYR